MPTAIYEQMMESGVTAKQVVYISANDTVAAVSGDNAAIFGVADDSDGRICVFGEALVDCSGTVAIGDLLIGAASAKVAKFTATTAPVSNVHAHSIADGGAQLADITDNDDGDQINNVVSSDLAGGKIIGKALTGGMDTEITMFVSLMG